jgi:hypothetical protein
MKKTIVFLFAGLSALFIGSCADHTAQTETDSKTTEYTVMFYGAGGGTLDASLLLNLGEVLTAGVSDTVKFTAQIKFSKYLQTDSAWQGTQRFYLEEGANDFTYEPVMDASLPLSDPAVLADYIQWSKGAFPAQKYILILWGHGNGWLPLPGRDGPQARSVVTDDNVAGMPELSVTALVEGIQRSATHIEVVYYDACLMNMLENLGELQEVANYCLAAGHLTPGMGGDYGTLLKLLSGSTDTVMNIVDYCYYTMAHWNVFPDRADITFTDLSKLPEVFTVVKKISEELRGSYEDDAILPDDYGRIHAAPYSIYYSYFPIKREKAEPGVYFYDAQMPYDETHSLLVYVDLYNYVQYLAVRTFNPKLFSYASELLAAMSEAIIYGEESDSLPVMSTFSVTLVGKDVWEHGTPLVPVLAYNNGAYEALAFDKATGWSKWLRTNEALPLIENPLE